MSGPGKAPPDPSGLAGKVVIVTGAGQGLGRAHALHLAGRGARVVVAEVVAERVKAVEDELTSDGHEVLGIPVDVTYEGSVAELVRASVAAFGRIDGGPNTALFGPPMMPDYVASKGAIMALTRSLARQQYPEDVVGAVAFLLSDHAAMITGQTVVVDGGLALN